jgi:hypothetical protein
VFTEGCPSRPFLKDETMISLRDLVVNRTNNFKLIRMITSSAVSVSHAYPISLDITAIEPLDPDAPAGELAPIGWTQVVGPLVGNAAARWTEIPDPSSGVSDNHFIGWDAPGDESVCANNGIPANH